MALTLAFANFRPVGSTTVSVLLPITVSPDRSCTSAVPSAAAVNTPFSETVPTSSFRDFHVMSAGSSAGLPVALTPEAISETEAPFVR